MTIATDLGTCRQRDYAQRVTKLASRQLVDIFWQHHLGIPQLGFGPSVYVLPLSGDYRDYQGAFCLKRGGACLLFVPPADLQEVKSQLEGKTPAEVFEPSQMRALFGDRIERIIGPAVYAYADASDLKKWSTGSARRLREDETARVKEFLASLSEADREVSGLDAETGALFGIFEGPSLKALGGYEIWGRQIAHIGIVTHPEARGEGYAKKVLSALTQEAGEEGMVMQYRTLCANAPSIAIAKRLGFQDYCLSIAVRFKGNV